MRTNKIHQYLFFLFVIVCSLFNAGNSNIYIQINFLFISFIFLICLKNKNYIAHLKIFLFKNKLPLLFFLLFILYLVFQLIPFPIEILKIVSYEKFNLLDKMKHSSGLFSMSFSPTDTYFQILNYITILICIFQFQYRYLN